jgi:predicted choloylglycine hydrolase
MNKSKRLSYQVISVLILIVTLVALAAGCSPAPAVSAADAAITAQTKQLYASVDTRGLIRKYWVDSAKDTTYGKDIVINGVKSTFHDGVAFRYPGMPPMLEVSGDHYEMGLQYGVLMRPEIYKAIDVWGRIIEAELLNGGFDPVEGFKYMKDPAVELAAQLPERLRNEMQGIADGSGLPVEAIETYTLMYDAGRTYANTACGGVLLKGANGTVIHARVRDCSDGGALEHARYEIIARQKPKGYNAITEIGWAGTIGGLFQGWNDKRITFAHNTTTVRKPNSDGFPSGFTSRIILEECSNLAEVEKVLATHLPINGYNGTVSDQRAGTGAVYEVTPTSWAKRDLKDNNPVWVFNNITDPKLYPQQTGSKDIGFAVPWGDTNGDRWRVASTFKVKNEYTIDDGIDAMQMVTGPDGADYSWSGTRQGISNLSTDVFIMYDPNGKGMYLGMSSSYASRKDIYYIDNDFSRQPTLYRKAIGVKQAAQDYADIRQNLPLDKERLPDYVDLAAKYSDDPQAQFVAGMHAFALKQPDKYAVYFEKAYALKPDNIEYKLFAGLAALTAKNNDKVISLLEDIKSENLYPAEELYRLTALQKAWKDRDQTKFDQYGQQINTILDKYQAQTAYKNRILPLLNAFGSQ